jgi:tetratricopeptide (TPR) repeat protein
MKASVLDTVELVEDVPEFNVRQGERAVVLDAYSEPEEAYDLEFVDNHGSSTRFAFSVRPDQLVNIDVQAKELYERGMKLQREGDVVEATRAFKGAIELRPSYIRSLHESFRISCIPSQNFEGFLSGLVIVKMLNPDYELARQNIAITYLNWGVAEAEKNNLEFALHLFQSALRAEAPPDVVQLVKENISGTHSMLGLREHQKGDVVIAVKHFETALSFNPNSRTRHDLGLAYANLADFLIENDRYDEAIVNYRYAEDTGLISASVYNNHAVALATTGKLELAIIILESALHLSPGDKTIENNLMNAVGKNISEIVREVHQLAFSSVPELRTVAASTGVA